MSVQYKNLRVAVVIAMTCALGSAAIIGSAGQAAADSPSNVLDVSNLQQLPDRSLADLRGGANSFQTFIKFFLQSLTPVTTPTVTQFNFQSQPGNHVDQQTHSVTVTLSN
jgi:hypothetical protein